MDSRFLASATPLTVSLQVGLGLTRSEAEIVQSLVKGARLLQIAHDRGVSINTVRNQVKSAMAKTGTRRQAELAVLVDRHLRG